MKNLKNLFIIAVAVIISIITVHNSTISQANAQCPVPPDCPLDPFVPGTPIVIMNGTCTTTVNWCWRFACGMYNDFVVTSIITSGICPGPMTAAQIQEAAFREAILQNPWGLFIPPCPQQSQSTWRLGKAACVAEYEIIGSGTTLLWPCKPHSRCWEVYSHCYAINPINGEITIQLTLISSLPSIPCSQTEPSDEEIPFEVILRSNCYNICN